MLTSWLLAALCSNTYHGASEEPPHMGVSLDQFIERATSTGLVSAADLSTLCGRLPPEQRPVDAEGLAKLLIREGKLTRYQASVIYQGTHKRGKMRVARRSRNE